MVGGYITKSISRCSAHKNAIYYYAIYTKTAIWRNGIGFVAAYGCRTCIANAAVAACTCRNRIVGFYSQIKRIYTGTTIAVIVRKRFCAACGVGRTVPRITIANGLRRCIECASVDSQIQGNYTIATCCVYYNNRITCIACGVNGILFRSEERRVGKEC